MCVCGSTLSCPLWSERPWHTEVSAAASHSTTPHPSSYPLSAPLSSACERIHVCEHTEVHWVTLLILWSEVWGAELSSSMLNTLWQQEESTVSHPSVWSCRRTSWTSSVSKLSDSLHVSSLWENVFHICAAAFHSYFTAAACYCLYQYLMLHLMFVKQTGFSNMSYWTWCIQFSSLYLYRTESQQNHLKAVYIVKLRRDRII